MPSFKTSGSKDQDFEGFAIYGHGGHLGYVTKTILINSCLPFQEDYTYNLALIGKAVLEKMFENNGHKYV